MNEFFYFYKVQVSDTKLLGKKGTTVIQLEKAGSEAEYIIRNVYQGSIVYLEKKYNKINLGGIYEYIRSDKNFESND